MFSRTGRRGEGGQAKTKQKKQFWIYVNHVNVYTLALSPTVSEEDSAIAEADDNKSREIGANTNEDDLDVAKGRWMNMWHT